MNNSEYFKKWNGTVEQASKNNRVRFWQEQYEESKKSVEDEKSLYWILLIAFVGFVGMQFYIKYFA